MNEALQFLIESLAVVGSLAAGVTALLAYLATSKVEKKARAERLRKPHHEPLIEVGVEPPGALTPVPDQKEVEA